MRVISNNHSIWVVNFASCYALQCRVRPPAIRHHKSSHHEIQATHSLGNLHVKPFAMGWGLFPCQGSWNFKWFGVRSARSSQIQARLALWHSVRSNSTCFYKDFRIIELCVSWNSSLVKPLGINSFKTYHPTCLTNSSIEISSWISTSIP